MYSGRERERGWAEQIDKDRDRRREREREREREGEKTERGVAIGREKLVSTWILTSCQPHRTTSGQKRETDRQTDTDRQRDRERLRETDRQTKREREKEREFRDCEDNECGLAPFPHKVTVCIWRCEHARFCVEVLFYVLYVNVHSFKSGKVLTLFSFLTNIVSPRETGHSVVNSRIRH